MSVSLRQLVYVMGPSGAGKDSLLEYSRTRLAGLPVAFARRHITRPAGAGGENHVAVSPQEFRLLLEQGRFAMHWRANGLCYGVGVEIDAWMAHGLLVVVNGSRGAYGDVLARYPDMLGLLVSASEAELRRRLTARGREGGEAVRARLERSRHVEEHLRDGGEIMELANEGSLEEAGEALSALLRSQLAKRMPALPVRLPVGVGKA